ncbi:BLUF domain-containing protein [Psychrobacter sp. F1192]|uniref:BLUF domain-containing protein n=1 Tax=Psychrobacter coccoides TaxID=2818440 RepID=A0ABS3NLH9_9GAMM|nr:BLUF domain-containing protein [Psychrobacter coccoides]MBO1530272.1 BLUF domain-containing protein [Psychrobacter coccoides]
MSLQHTDKGHAIEQLADTALIQMVYVSSLSLKGRLSSSIFVDLGKHARAYNTANGITGILCYGNGHFLQCIEGEKAKVEALQQRIFTDSRHKNIKILLLQAIHQRSFMDWRMRSLFLERWLWSPETKQQASQLAVFLPFRPYAWEPERTEYFLQVIKNFDNSPHVKATRITYSAMANKFRHIIAPHQAFLVIQGFLAILLVMALLWLYF